MIFGIVLLVWFVFSYTVSRVAKAKGRGEKRWFLAALLFSPLWALLMVAAIPVKESKTRENQRRRVEPQLDADDDGLPSLRAARI